MPDKGMTSRDTMDDLLLVVMLVVIGFITAGALVAVALSKRGKEANDVGTDYRAQFILGLSLIPVGIVGIVAIHIGFVGILGLGVALMAMGLAKRDEWKCQEARDKA